MTRKRAREPLTAAEQERLAVLESIVAQGPAAIHARRRVRQGEITPQWLADEAQMAAAWLYKLLRAGGETPDGAIKVSALLLKIAAAGEETRRHTPSAMLAAGSQRFTP